ncbi:MAG TPA: nuclear transport factor 2 family protein, partial [Verrucomicrobiales bacterium]|nr:nuclear transport factor 2 family protein [Verrucomicrobiales bacterium]
MSRADALDLLRRYYAAFNAGDRETFFSLLTEDVVHDINQGGAETGIAAFRTFMERMDRCYREQIEDLVLMADDSGTRA